MGNDRWYVLHLPDGRRERYNAGDKGLSMSQVVEAAGGTWKVTSWMYGYHDGTPRDPQPLSVVLAETDTARPVIFSAIWTERILNEVEFEPGFRFTVDLVVDRTTGPGGGGHHSHEKVWLELAEDQTEDDA